MKQNYSVILIEDYSTNRGNPNVSTFLFNSLQEATAFYDKELQEEYTEHGGTCHVQLMQEDEVLKENQKTSGLIPEGSIIVTYQHKTYMRYCYTVSEVREVRLNERYEDLNYNEDHTGSDWDAIFTDSEELSDVYYGGLYAPFDKLQSGGDVVEEFLEERGIEG